MKKILSIAIVLILTLSLVIPALAEVDRPLLVDSAGFLSETEAQNVENKLQQMSDELDFDIVIVTTKDLKGKSKMEYADDFFDYGGYGIGRQGDRSGVLLLVYDTGYGTTERWISTSGYGITAFTDYGIQYVGSQLIDLMDSGEWETAFLKFVNLTEQLVSQAKEGNPLDVSKQPQKQDVMKGLIISLIVGLVIAAIVVSMVKSSYKPVKFKANASDYLVSGSLNVTGAYDNFRTSSVSRVAIQSKSSSGGSSTHTSSSGRSHGGGGF